MYGIKELAEVLGLSEKQVRRRLSLILPHLDGHCRKGPRGKILVDERGLEILREMVSRERAGSSLQEAAKSVMKFPDIVDTNGNGTVPRTLREGTGTCGKDGERSRNGQCQTPKPNGETTLSGRTASSGKVEVREGVLWLLIALCLVSVLLQVAILLSLYF